MIPRRSSVGRQEQNVGQVVADEEARGLKVENGRDEYQPVEIHAVPLLQISGQTRSARGAVTFADDEFGRRPAFVACGLKAD